MSKSGTSRVESGERRYFRRNQHRQQRGGIAVERDCTNRWLKKVGRKVNSLAKRASAQRPRETERSWLGKEATLNLRNLNWLRAFLIIIRHGIDSCAHGITPHQPSIAGLQEFARHSQILHPRIEPDVIAIRIKDDRHAVVHRCRRRIRSRGQNRAARYPAAAAVLPAIP